MKILLIMLGVFLTSCRSASISLPPDLEYPVLTDSIEEGYTELFLQDIRWRLWANRVRYLAGVISNKEYARRRRLLTGALQ